MRTREWLRLAELDRRQVETLAAEAVLVVPIGATEQHGPALPLGTDTALAQVAAEAALDRTRTHRRMVLAPAVPYGNSVHHLFACAGSVTASTLLLVLADLIDSFVRSRFRRIVLVNGHGGNDECVRLAVKDAVNRHPVLLAAVNYWSLAGSGPVPTEHVPGHAGAFEASLLMTARPDLLPPDSVHTNQPGPRAVHTEDFGPGVTVVRAGDWAASGGFTDDPATAHAAAGGAYLDSIGTRLAEVLDRFADTELLAETGATK